MTSREMPDMTAEGSAISAYLGQTVGLVRVKAGPVFFMAQVCFPETGGMWFWLERRLTRGAAPEVGATITVTRRKEVIATGTLATISAEAELRLTSKP